MAYAASQDKPIVPETAYNGAFPGTATTDTYSRITDTSLWSGGPVNGAIVVTGGTGYTSAPGVTIIGGGGTGATASATVAGGVVTAVNILTTGNGYTSAPIIMFSGPPGSSGASAVPVGWHLMEPKAIQELFETEYGRMNATLGVELPFTNVTKQTTIPLGYIDPTTEDITNSVAGTLVGSANDGTQIWKITHNGVDTHAIHFHLFNVQIINRVGWDGAIRPPSANELGWKETVIMNPLEDCIVAMRPIAPTLPFKIGDSVRPLDPTRPIGSTMGFTGIDPNTGNPIVVTNQLANFGWEYVWHCHLLGHEENDMMRPIAFKVSPAAPSVLGTSLVASPLSVSLKWTRNWTYPLATTQRIERATNSAFTGTVAVYAAAATATTFSDTAVTAGTTYYYRVRAENTISYSTWTNTASILVQSGPTAPSNLRTITVGTTSIGLRWNDNSNNETGFRLYRSLSATGPWTLITSPARNATTYTNTGLARVTTYYYYIVAFNANGVSAPSNILRVTTL